MFFGDKKILALDIGTSSVKLAEIEPSRKGPMLKKFAVYPLSPGLVNGGEIVDAGGVAQAVDSLVRSSKSKRKHVATGMWGTSVIVKKISMPKMEDKLVAEQIKWEAEQYIPFDINEISLEHHILRNRSSMESMDVLLVAAKQEFLFRFMESIESVGLKCAVVDVAGFALANCFEANYGVVDGIVSLVNVGAGVTNLVVLERGEVIFCRDIPVGGATYTAEINKQMGISLTEAEALKISASLGQEVPDEVNNILASTNDQVVEEIRNSFAFFGATSGGLAANRMFVSGGSIFVPGLVDQVSRAAGVNYEILDPFQRITYDPKAMSADYVSQIKAISPVALGLAMRKLGDA